MHQPRADADPATKRLLVLVGILFVTLGLVLFYAVLVERSVVSQLSDEPIVVEGLSVRVPESWERDRQYAYPIVLRSDDAEMIIARLPGGEAASASSVLQLASQSEVSLDLDGTRVVTIDGARPATIGGESGLIATFGYALRGGGIMGTMRTPILLYRTVVAGVAEDGSLLMVYIQRSGDWDGRDAQIVRAVAETMKVTQ
jgi:hypothetical protein